MSLLGLSAIGLFMSTLTDVPVGAMAATIVVAVTSQVLDLLPQLDWLHPWLLSHYWLGFADLHPPAHLLGFVRRQCHSPGRLHCRLRCAGVRSVPHEGHPVLNFRLGGARWDWISPWKWPGVTASRLGYPKRISHGSKAIRPPG